MEQEKLPSISLIQLNIEHSKHLNLVLPFLLAQKPDVICLQELCEVDIAQFERELGMQCIYAPMAIESGKVGGVGIFTRLSILNTRALQYGGNSGKELPIYDSTDRYLAHDTCRFVYLVCDIEKEGNIFRIGTTHFPVTHKGVATDYQRKDMKSLLELLAQEGEFVLTGDFNAPRGGEIFAMLADVYTDNVPPKYIISLDTNLHRADPVELAKNAKEMGVPGQMVDGIFSTSGYSVSDVEMVSGVSDHCALVARVHIATT